MAMNTGHGKPTESARKPGKPLSTAAGEKEGIERREGVKRRAEKGAEF